MSENKIQRNLFIPSESLGLIFIQTSVRGFCRWIHTVNDCLWFLLSAFSLDAEQPDYDLDSEDEIFVNKLKKKMDICPLQFEEMIDRLEKGSGQQVQLNYVYIISVCVFI